MFLHVACDGRLHMVDSVLFFVIASESPPMRSPLRRRPSYLILLDSETSVRNVPPNFEFVFKEGLLHSFTSVVVTRSGADFGRWGHGASSPPCQPGANSQVASRTRSPSFSILSILRTSPCRIRSGGMATTGLEYIKSRFVVQTW